VPLRAEVRSRVRHHGRVLRCGRPVSNFIWPLTPPRAATEADLARIVQFNRTETTFPDNVTLQELIEAQIDKHSFGRQLPDRVRGRPGDSSASHTRQWYYCSRGRAERASSGRGADHIRHGAGHRHRVETGACRDPPWTAPRKVVPCSLPSAARRPAPSSRRLTRGCESLLCTGPSSSLRTTAFFTPETTRLLFV